VIKPERRTRADLIATAVISVVTAVAWLVLWYTSDEHATTSSTAAPPAPSPAAVTIPTAVHTLWSAPSSATAGPLVLDSTVVTADGSTVTGRDPATGESRWLYSRDLRLCTVGSDWTRALAVYTKGENCSEVTALIGGTGKRDAARNSDADLGTRLLFDGSHAIATGRDYVEGWRSDLVKTMQYGYIRAQVNPNRQPRTGCSYGSFAVATERLGLIERCPGEDSDRLTILNPDPHDTETPDVVGSALLGFRGTRLIALAGDRAAVLLPAAGDQPTRLGVYTGTGERVSGYPLDLPGTDTTGDPAGLASAITTGAAAIYWWTGSSTIALDANDLHPLWTLPGALGPGAMFVNKMLVPVPGGLDVVDALTGEVSYTIPVDRAGYNGLVQLGVSGGVIVEQRGGQIVALA
jgi:hypothetical protein